jgi:Zn-dependent peptidase ImmA (M78 family)
MPNVNPEILRWARETAGLTLEEAAAKLSIADARGVSADKRLAAYEVGEAEPSRPLLMRMSKQYRRPLLAFYMSSVPRTAERVEDFRTLPPEHSRSQDALVDALIRDVRARQEMVRALLEDEEEAVRLPFVGSMSMRDGVEAVLQSIRETLDLDLEQYRGRKGRNGGLNGFAYLREQAERVGVYVLLIGNLGSHHTSLDVEIFRGFALADEVAPFIVINDQDSEKAWAFTLLHELCHIWLGQTGVSSTSAANAVEQFCNDVAGRFFLPRDEVQNLAYLRGRSFDDAVAAIGDFAETRNVSRSMVAYKLFRENIIEREMWSGLSTLFRTQWRQARDDRRERNRDHDGGPNYYIVRRHRVGEALLGLTRRMLAGQALAPSKAAKLLGVKPSNVYSMVNNDRGSTGPLRLAQG